MTKLLFNSNYCVNTEQNIWSVFLFRSQLVLSRLVIHHRLVSRMCQSDGREVDNCKEPWQGQQTLELPGPGQAGRPRRIIVTIREKQLTWPYWTNWKSSWLGKHLTNNKQETELMRTLHITWHVYIELVTHQFLHCSKNLLEVFDHALYKEQSFSRREAFRKVSLHAHAHCVTEKCPNGVLSLCLNLFCLPQNLTHVFLECAPP